MVKYLLLLLQVYWEERLTHTGALSRRSAVTPSAGPISWPPTVLVNG